MPTLLAPGDAPSKPILPALYEPVLTNIGNGLLVLQGFEREGEGATVQEWSASNWPGALRNSRRVFQYSALLFRIRHSFGIAIEYQTGRVVTGSGVILPMIEIRQYLDDQANVHDRVWTFAMKERMFRDKGHADNLVAWVYASNLDESFFTRLALQGMDDWLKRINAAPTRKTGQYERTVIRQKPEWLGDACWDPNGQKIDEVFVYNAPSRCNALFPTFLMPRMVAGGPLANDVFKCALKPVDLGDYVVSFTTDEQQRLRNIFAQGVCDWLTAAVERQPFQGTWQSFGQ